MEYEKDSNGEFILDNNGEKIPKVTNSDEDTDKKIKEAMAPLVEEIKELRAERGLYKDLLEGKTPKQDEPKTPLTEDEKIAAAVSKALSAEKSANAQANKTAAFEKFVNANKEFHQDNDSFGIKREALKKKFLQFNTDGLFSEEEFTSVIRDAYRLLVGNDKQPEASERQPFTPQPPIPRVIPKVHVVSELSDREKKLAEQTGRSPETILKLRQKNPEFLEELLKYVRD